MTDVRPPLTEQQTRCLALAHYRLTSKEIGLALSISENTVNNHLKEGMWRLGASDRRQAAALAAQRADADALVQEWLDQTLAMAIPDIATLRRRSAERASADEPADTALELGRSGSGPSPACATPEASRPTPHALAPEGRRDAVGSEAIPAGVDGRRRYFLPAGEGQRVDGGQHALTPFELFLLVAAAVGLLLILGEALLGHLVKILQQLSH